MVRLWEIEASVLLENLGTMPFAVLAGGKDKETLLQEVANKIEKERNLKAREEITAATYVLAGLTLSDNVIKQVLRSEMMRESVTFQAILQEGRQVGIQEGRQEGQLWGKREMLKRLINRKFGSLSDPFLSQLERFTSPQLEDLAEAILDMQTSSDLEQWYERLD